MYKGPTGIDLFCGAGGMSLGFCRAGVNVLAAFDLEQLNIDTYNANIGPHAYRCDLSKAAGKDLLTFAGVNNVDIVFGGPPCQGFSMIGKRDLNDERNDLMLHFARLVTEIRPRYYVIENVSGLLLGHARGYLDRCLDLLRAAGYEALEPKLIDASNHGVPQRRLRTFALGMLQGLVPPVTPTKSNMVPTVWDAIGDLPRLGHLRSHYSTDQFLGTLGAPSSYAAMLRMSSAHVLTGCMVTQHTPEVIHRFSNTRQGQTEPISRYPRLRRTGLCPTLRAGTGPDRGSFTAVRPIHPYRNRCITTREAARLHSYPDSFIFNMARWHAFRQIGNSVPPLLAQAIASGVTQVLR